jgi:hypothetical protein
MKPEKKTIREAVCANRGGWTNASDQDIMRIWGSLDKQTQKAYLESVKLKTKKTEKTNALDM